MAALGSLAIQIVVPALPLLASGIGASREGGQLIITLYLIVLALGQLGWAPVADHHGRRPVLLWGAAIFLTGTLCCGAASALSAMLAGRAIQAAGAAALLVSARAMATDQAPPGKAAAPLALVTSVTLISPAIAPAVGGMVASVGGWRALFWILALLAVVAGAMALRILPETRAGDGAPLHPRRLLANYARVARHRGYVALASSNALINGGFYTFLAVSPFILQKHGAPPALAGLFYSFVAGAIIGGTLLVPVILARRPAWLYPIGAIALATGAAMIALVALSGAPLVGLLAAMSFLAIGSGLTGPTLLAEAIERQRERASAAISLFGTIQMGGAALISTAVVRLAASAETELGLIGALVLLALAIRWLVRSS